MTHDLFRIEPGTRRDYESLARTHYRAGPPATFDAVLRAVGSPGSRHAGALAGVLVASRPTLNASWRVAAWGRAFAPRAGKREAARRLNAQVRTISRVVVAPAWRGLGVARALVEAYLRRPRARRTEAVAAMARYCPFFAAAGMREVRAPAPRRAAALARALRRAGIAPWRLLDGRAARRAARDPLLRDAARRFARAGRAGRALAGLPDWALLASGAAWLACRPRVFVRP